MSTPAKAREIFDHAREFIDPGERSGYLRGACGGDADLLAEVESLLAADAEAGEFLRTISHAAATIISHDPESPGQLIGRYKLLQLIGEGGFGSVWMAEQKEPVKRRVALKIIKLGMDTKQVVARFEAERQALAMMDHPSIARVLDAGATEIGRPFFVMELVRGVPILEYCDTEKLATEKRLELFVDVCNAIQHAHQKGIIHRDIKPSNILVTLYDGKPVPKVIDFGIAKATSGELTDKTLFTQHRQMIGTPAYMSPEQAEMSGLDIDTRSDIYSLGVLLYELLTGTTPFSHDELMSKGFAEMMRIIRDVEPHKPSTRLSTLGETATRTAQFRQAEPGKLRSILKDDLDWIVMKCLEKDRQRRYDTVNGLGMDIRRYLAGEAVTAAPPSSGYLVRKFMRRHRVPVTFVAAVAAALLIGIIAFSWQAQFATAQRDLAEREAQRALAAEASAIERAEQLQLFAAFQAGELAQVDAARMGLRIRSALTERHRAALIGAGRGEKEAQEAMDEFEVSLAGVNFTDVALRTLDESTFSRTLQAIRETFSDQPLIKASLLQTMADSMRALGLLDRATAPQAEALAIRRSVLGGDHPDLLTSAHGMGILTMNLGKLPEADVYLQEALEGRRIALGDDHPDTLESVVGLGELRFLELRLGEAEPLFREALERQRRILGDRHPDTFTALNFTGNLLRQQRRSDEAEPYLREALEGRRGVLGDEHPDTLSSLNAMGLLLRQQGKTLETEHCWREALTARRRVLGDEHPATLTSINNLGGVLRDQERFAEAEPLFLEALRTRRRTLGDDHPHTLQSFRSLGFTYFAQGKYVDAEAQYRTHWQNRIRVLGEDHPIPLGNAVTVARCLIHQNRLDEAEEILLNIVERSRRAHGNEHDVTRTAFAELTGLLQRRGKHPGIPPAGGEEDSPRVGW